MSTSPNASSGSPTIPTTGVIMIYLEGCRDGARLRAALARAAANRKPVIAMKVGVSEQGVAAIASHTGSLAGSDAVFDAVFAENNVHRARSLDELVDVAYACSGGVFPKSPRLGVVTLSGGVGIQMADAAAEMGLELPRMPDAAQQKVLAMVPFAGPANPVDTTAQVVNDWTMFTTILGIVADEGAVDSVVSFLAHMGTTPGLMDRLKPAFLEVRQRFPDRVFVLCARMPREMADEFTALGFLIFEDPNRADRGGCGAGAVARGLREGRARRAAVGQAGAKALPAGPINEADAKRLLGAAGVPFAPERVARTREEAVAAAEGDRLSGRAEGAVRRHRAQVGSRRRRARAAAVPTRSRSGYDAMMARVREREPNARLEGALVARMIEGGVETVIGIKRDPVFGPVVMFGLGGVYVEVLKDVTLRLAPVDHATAQEMIRGIKGFPLLAGARGKPPVDLDALADALVAMSRFGAAHADVCQRGDQSVHRAAGRRRRGRRADPDEENAREHRSREAESRDHRAARLLASVPRRPAGAEPGIPAAYLKFQDGPARSGHLEPKVREFIYIAIDGAVSHLYERGLRRHIEDALRLGATKEEVLQVIMLATAARGTDPERDRPRDPDGGTGRGARPR